MAALTSGKKAPDFTLPTLDGSQFSLSDALSNGPVVLAFFKISCPVCQYAFPFIERMYQRLRDKNVTIIGVSQDSPADTKLFVSEFSVTFPIALDDSRSGYKVSNAYGLTTVPTLFDIDTGATIVLSSVGWSRQELLDVYLRRNNSPAAVKPLFQPGEQVSDFRAG